ncbi:MAG: ImmA/IrrE family metallo-endopeptidase, partial [Imperialibacter sp.]
QVIPVPFFKSKNLLTGDPVEDVRLIKQLYGVEEVSRLQLASCAPSLRRMSTSLKADERNITAWLRYVQYQSHPTKVSPFNLEVKDDLITELKLLIRQNKNLTGQVQEALGDAGIKLIYEEKGSKTPIDGISFWSNGSPAIGMTLRHSRLDNFAFTLFHELGHVFLHLSEGPETEFVDFEAKFTEKSYVSDPREEEANHFAQNNLIAPDIWRKYVSRGFTFNDYIIRNMAENAGIHPAVVKGRLCHELNNYKVRSSIENKIK